MGMNMKIRTAEEQKRASGIQKSKDILMRLAEASKKSEEEIDKTNMIESLLSKIGLRTDIGVW